MTSVTDKHHDDTQRVLPGTKAAHVRGSRGKLRAGQALVSDTGTARCQGPFRERETSGCSDGSQRAARRSRLLCLAT